MGSKLNRPDEEYIVDNDGTLGANSDSLIPTQKAVKTYVDNNTYGQDLLDLIVKGDGSVVWITTTGSFSITVPSWANCMYVSGAGGGGGGNASHGLGGGGGMSINRTRYAVTGGVTLSGSIGTGGAGATSYNASPSNVPGTNGGNTVLTGVVTLYGGYGGGNHPTSQWYGGAGGGAGSTSGGIRMLMGYGGTPTSIYIGGNGGDSLFGKGGKGGYYPNNYGGITSVNGSNGIGFGGGGGGGGTDSNNNITTGGTGSQGFLAIEFAYEE